MQAALAHCRDGELDFPELRRRFVNAAMADRKGGATTTGVRHFLRFCVYGRRISPARGLDNSSPLTQKLAAERLLMDFGIWLVLSKPTGRTISIDTAVKYVSTANAWHKRHFGAAIAADLDLSRLRDLFKGMRRELSQPAKRVRYGVRTQHLAEALALFHSAERGSEHFVTDLNWRAACSTAFCGLMRAAEVALQSGETWDPELHLSRADLTFHRTADGMRYCVVMMRPVKNGKTMRGKSVPLTLMGGGALLDPVEDLWRLVTGDPVAAADKASTPLFRKTARGARVSITVDDVRDEVKMLMHGIGQDPARFGAHSLRIGGATSAAAAGIDPAVIRCCGRWSSDVYEIYTRLTKQAAAKMTATIASTAFDDLERGEFHTEELELLPEEMGDLPEFEMDELAPPEGAA